MRRDAFLRDLNRYCRKNGLSYEWVAKRGKGGHGIVTVNGVSTTVQSDLNGNLSNEVSGDYTSLQASADYGCYDGRFEGWSLVFGATGGVNNGSTTQDQFAFSGSGGVGAHVSVPLVWIFPGWPRCWHPWRVAAMRVQAGPIGRRVSPNGMPFGPNRRSAIQPRPSWPMATSVPARVP